jgi:hypothetical protein
VNQLALGMAAVVLMLAFIAVFWLAVGRKL